MKSPLVLSYRKISPHLKKIQREVVMGDELVKQGGSLIAKVLGQFATSDFWKDLGFKLLRDGVQRAISGVVNAIIDVFRGAIPPEHQKTQGPSSVFNDSRQSYNSSRYRSSSAVPVSSYPAMNDYGGFPNLPANF